MHGGCVLGIGALGAVVGGEFRHASPHDRNREAAAGIEEHDAVRTRSIGFGVADLDRDQRPGADSLLLEGLRLRAAGEDSGHCEAEQ